MQCTQVEKGIPATWEYTEPENKRIVFIQFITIFSTKFWKKYIICMCTSWLKNCLLTIKKTNSIKNVSNIHFKGMKLNL